MSDEISILKLIKKTRVSGPKTLRKQCYINNKTNINYYIINLL